MDKKLLLFCGALGGLLLVVFIIWMINRDDDSVAPPATGGSNKVSEPLDTREEHGGLTDEEGPSESEIKVPEVKPVRAQKRKVKPAGSKSSKRKAPSAAPVQRRSGSKDGSNSNGKMGQGVVQKVNAPSSPGSKIIARSQTGKSISLNVDLSDTVLSVREKIAAEEKVNSAQVVLMHSGKKLEDAHTLAECKIQDGAIIMLMIRSAGPAAAPTPTYLWTNSKEVIVKSSDPKKVYKVTVVPSTTVENLKEKIDGMSNYVAGLLDISCDGVDLPNQQVLGNLEEEKLKRLQLRYPR